MLKNILKLENATKLNSKQQKAISGGRFANCFAICGPTGGQPNGHGCDCY